MGFRKSVSNCKKERGHSAYEKKNVSDALLGKQTQI